MKKIFYIIFVLSLLIISCEKDNTGLEVFKFKEEDGYTSKDKKVKYLGSVKIGIIAEYTPPFSFKITNNGTNIFDTVVNLNYLNFDFTIIKNLEKTEELLFSITENENVIQSLELNIQRDTSITAIDSFFLGAQLNDTLGSFYSISRKSAYNDSVASVQQGNVDLIYYYDSNSQNYIITSPKEDIPSFFREEYSPETWDTRRETLFCLTEYSTAEFDALNGDDLLITSFISTNTLTQITIQENKVYSFQTANQKYALFKVIDITGTEQGVVRLSIKTQK